MKPRPWSVRSSKRTSTASVTSRSIWSKRDATAFRAARETAGEIAAGTPPNHQTCIISAPYCLTNVRFQTARLTRSVNNAGIFKCGRGGCRLRAADAFVCVLRSAPVRTGKIDEGGLAVAASAISGALRVGRLAAGRGLFPSLRICCRWRRCADCRHNKCRRKPMSAPRRTNAADRPPMDAPPWRHRIKPAAPRDVAAPGFVGDRAAIELRRRLALDGEAVPQPPLDLDAGRPVDRLALRVCAVIRSEEHTSEL